MYEDNRFVKKSKYYKRPNLYPMEAYLDQAAWLLSKNKQISLEASRLKVIEANRRRYNNPVLDFYDRDPETLDRHSTTDGLKEYLVDINKTGNILAPTGTTYVPKTVHEGTSAVMMDSNKKLRSILKREAFEAKAVKDMDRFEIKNRGQINAKLNNNSLSGVVSIRSSFLYSDTFHTTLTSTTRTMTSIAVLATERFISGRRLLDSYESTLRSIVEPCSDIQYVSEIERILSKYKLIAPSAEQMYEDIILSTRNYWNDVTKEKKLWDFINKITPVERAAYMFNGNLNALMMTNDTYTRNLFDGLTNPPEVKVDDPDSVIDTFSDLDISTIAHMFNEELRGKGTAFKKLPKALKVKIASFHLGYKKVLETNFDLLRTLFANKHLSLNTSDTKDLVRRAVVLSDTDSVGFTAQEVSYWYTGEYKVTPMAIRVAGIVSSFVSLIVEHGLKQLSYHIGVAPEDDEILNMKSEFLWSSFSVPLMTKHYFAKTLIIEGNVLDKPELEKKGAHFKSASLPTEVLDSADKLMNEISAGISSGKGVDLNYVLKEIAIREKVLKELVSKGDTAYLKTLNINSPDSYKNVGVHNNSSKHLLFWNDVYKPETKFEVHYPYKSLKLNLIFKNKTSWIAFQNENPGAIVDRWSAWLNTYTKAAFPKTAYIPLEYAIAYGIPPLLLSCLDVNKISNDVLNIMYKVLATLGVAKSDDVSVTEMLEYRQDVFQEDFKLIVAGGREFSDYDLLSKEVSYLIEHIDRPVKIISGGAKGADSLAITYSTKELGEDPILVEAKWTKEDGTLDRGAGYKRNSEMAKIADGLIAFWDGQSPGTANMIKLMTDMGKSVNVIDYTP